MGQKIVLGPIPKGLRNDVTAFNIEDNSFASLINAYQWRGRVKRKRGTEFLSRLERFFNSTSTSYSNIATIALVAGSGNLLTGFSLQTNGNIVPGSVIITNTTVAQTYTDPSMNGTLVGNIGGTGTINYATGAFTILGGAGNSVSAVFRYYPDLPVMGLEDLVLQRFQYPRTLGFDTKYSYNITVNAPYTSYDVSFYKNPPVDAVLLPGYTPKTVVTPTSWNGQDYQQFWTVNYEGALWATNGITVPFDPTNIGMQFKPIVAVTVLSPTTANLQITAHGLVVGDFVFVNEVISTTGINFQTGYVTTVTDANNVIVTFPFAALATNGTLGIAQYLTNRSDITKDCLRWYDGDPTNGSSTAPTLTGNNGWVNFAPPLSLLPYSVAEKPLEQYYLVGARMIVPFKDRLLFIGPVIQTSSPNSQLYLQDTVIYSQNGTPYYTSSYINSPTATIDDPTTATTVFNPILTPINQISNSPAYFEDQTGFGGFASAGIDQPILTTSINEDVLILGFNTIQTRFVYSGNDVVPFNFFIINSELGSSSTFSSITMDKGVISRGNRGYIITGQVDATRIDLDIPDEVFQISLINNGAERFTSSRDFINEWILFTYPANELAFKFPNETLFYNYRDNSWALFYENYTHHGTFRRVTGETWATIGSKFPTWEEWTLPWNAGTSTLNQQQVISGNQQGFVLLHNDGTGEGKSLEITNISFPVTITGATATNPVVLTANNTFVVGQSITITNVLGMTQLNGNTYNVTGVTPTTITIGVNGIAFTPYVSGGIATPPTIYSPNHGLNTGDYIVISGAIGTVAANVNGIIFSVGLTTNDEFYLNPLPNSGTYLGLGLIKRMYVPFIQSKQFPTAWGIGRKVRLGAQQYLLTTTDDGEIQLLIYLSQDSDSPYNDGPIVPQPNVNNSSLIYSTTLKTCPELYTQICNNIPLGTIGNGVLTMIMLNLSQLFNLDNTIAKGSVLITIGNVATFTDDMIGGFTVTGTAVALGSSINYATGAIVLVFSIAPISQASKINFNYYYNNIQSPLAQQQEQIWHRLNTSLLGDTVQFALTMSDEQMRDITFGNQFAEIEFHSAILDVTPSQMLS
ncbi:MAG: ubiquitin-activating E1 FCCH domain-containing protein [Flavobacterium sp.]